MVDEADGKVSSLKEKKLKALKDKEGGKEKDKPKPQPAKVDLFMMIKDAMNHDKHSVLPDFPERYHVIEPDEGVRLVVKENKNREVYVVNDKAVRNAIADYTSKTLRKHSISGYKWDVKKCTECFQFWQATTDPLENISVVSWQNDPGLTYARLPWDKEAYPSGDHPLFNEMFSRMTNAQAVSEWIGSLFDPHSFRHQYLWIHGSGGNGKSALVRFLQKVFKKAFRSKQPPREHDTHWTAGLLGARLVVFPDCNDFAFPSSGVFKSLTGGDLVDINPKFKESFSADLNVKYMYLSNGKPGISSDEADMRRAIYSEIGSIPEGVTEEDRQTYEERLWKEGGAFLSTCIHNYETYAKSRPIRTDKEAISDWVSTVEEPLEEFFHKYFVISKADHVTPRQDG
jgi:hypothetical protein